MQVMKKLLQYTLLFLMGIQILMGGAYIVLNIGKTQQFMESIRLFGLGEQLVSDGYTGILYSALLWLCHILSGGAYAVYANGITTIPFSAFISVLQLVCFAAATWYFLGVWMEYGWKKAVCTAYLLTVPFLLQMHLAVLPWSLGLSAVEVMLGGFLRLVRQGNPADKEIEEPASRMDREKNTEQKKNTAQTDGKKDILCMSLGLMAAGLIRVDLFWICGLFLLCALSLLFIKKETRESAMASGENQWEEQGKEQSKEQSREQCRRQWKKLWLVFFLVEIAVFTVNRVTYVPQEDRIQNSFQASMVSRFVWPNFATNYYFWSDEVKEAISLEDAVKICQREDALESFFGPVMEQKYGYQKAKSLYLEMAYQCFMDRTKEEILMLAEDIKDYILIPFTVERNLSGEGTSLTAWNYGRMQEHAPWLVKYYYRYSLLVLPVMLLISIVVSMARMSWKINFRFNKIQIRVIRYLVGFGIWYGLWFAMASNKPIDYKLVLPVVFIWYLLGISGVVEKK